MNTSLHNDSLYNKDNTLRDNTLQGRYCRCIMHVLGKSINSKKKYNPYAVCTSRIPPSKSIATGGCLDYYHFEDFTTEELRAYAKFKKLKVSNSGSKQELIDLLYKFVIVSKSMDVWNVYRQKFKQDHPNLPYKELLKQASIQYNLEKQELLNKL